MLSEVFSVLDNNEGIQHIFIGEVYRKVPVFSNELVVNGFFEVLGRIISQGGPGFTYLSPTVYWYLATGDLSKASCADVSNKALLTCIDKILDASDRGLGCATNV